MKKLYLSLVLAFIVSSIQAQSEKMKAVFEVTSSDIKVHDAAIRHVKGMAEAYPESEFELVIYGAALPMMLQGRSSVQTDIENLAKVNNVALRVCAIALKKLNLDTKDLISGVATVPNGIVEVIEKQAEGWAYIKESN